MVYFCVETTRKNEKVTTHGDGDAGSRNGTDSHFMQRNLNVS